MPRVRQTVLLLLALALIAAGCGGGDDDSGDEVGAGETTTTASETSLSPTTTEPTRTTAVDGEGDAGPTFPLTGLPADDADMLERPALAIKIDNHPDARPQVGVNQADMIYEEVVEGSITRFVTIFHSQDSDPVGPVRSARTSDIQILGDFEKILFANSGGNAGTLNRVAQTPYLVNANVNALPGEYYRQSGYSAPHNLFSNTSALIASGEGEVPPPRPVFTFGDTSGGRAISRVDIDFVGTKVSFTWDEELHGWARTENGKESFDGADVRIAPTNVVILETQYGRSPADPGSPEAVVTGTGTAYVLSDGTLREGTWTREQLTDTPTLAAADGSIIDLEPGQVWVAMPKADKVAFTN